MVKFIVLQLRALPEVVLVAQEKKMLDMIVQKYLVKFLKIPIKESLELTQVKFQIKIYIV